MRRAFNHVPDIDAYDFNHEYVDHNIEYIYPKIERTLTKLKVKSGNICRYWMNRPKVDTYLCEFMYRRYGKDNPLNKILECIKFFNKINEGF